MECTKTFFGGVMPIIDITHESIEALAKDSVNQGLCVPGVQKKLSLHLTHSKKDQRLTLIGYPTGYIFKPQTEDYENLPEAEDFAMSAAQAVGIRVVPFGLVKMSNGEYGYITKRIDREIKKASVAMYAMEDFCQISLRRPEDKYKGSYEQCAKIIAEYSTRPGLDLAELYLRVVFSFIIGNSDMHMKNLSLIEKTPGKRDFVLSPAYDILAVNLVNSEDSEEFAITMCGKKSNIKYEDFIEFADRIGLSEKVAKSIIADLIVKKEKILNACANSYMPTHLKEREELIIVERFKRLIE